MTTLTRYGFCVLGIAVLVVTLNAQSDFEAKLVGKWKLDTARSRYEGLPRPTEAKLVISAASPSRLKFQTTGRYVKGGQATWKDTAFDGAIDGKFYDYKAGERSAMRMAYVDKGGTLEGTAKYPDGTVGHESISISEDGNTMTSISSVSLPKGAASWTEVWDRVPDKKRR
jgi:hypothetical protein